MEFYHVLNRGVEKRTVFQKDGDYIRFIHDLYVFNDIHSAPNYIVKERQRERRRELLVHIHAFCLMPNHYHLLVSPVRKDGLSLFMRKLNMGYAKYFNEKYNRNGVLWQGVFKRIPVTRDAYFMYIPYYIHLNPLDLVYSEWREGQIKNNKKALAYLRNYRWSSLLDHMGVHNFPSIIRTTELRNLLGTQKHQEKEMTAIISNSALAQQSAVLEI